MRTLIIATNTTPTGLGEEIRSGNHPRVDYLELCRRFDCAYMDWNSVPDHQPVRWIENNLRLDFRQAAQVAGVVRRRGIEQVYSMSERVGIPLALMLPRYVRHVVTFAHPLSPKKLALIQQLGLSRRWDLMLAATQPEAEALRYAFHLGPERIRLQHYPVDALFYQPSAEVMGPRDHYESLGLSYRDYPTLLQAMAMLPEVNGYLRVGSTWVNGSAGFRREDIHANMSLKPFVHPAELRRCYQSSRFIVVPIRHTTQWSAGCTAVSQAQAMGRAVIATRTPGMADYVIDGETGLLVEPGDPKSLAEAIRSLWKDPERADGMGRRGREFVLKSFLLDDWLDRMEALLHGVERVETGNTGKNLPDCTPV